MYRAKRFEGKDLSKEMSSYIRPVKSSIKFMKNYNNRSVTTNGAVGYKTTTHPLLDLNFKVSSLRDLSEENIVKEFIKAYYDEPKYAVKWLFFLRDILQGMGERRTFRVCIKYLAQSHPDVARAVMKLIPKYGRCDDLLVLLDTPLVDDVCKLIKEQLDEDLQGMAKGRQISLLGKWLPSINTSSVEARRYGRILAKKLRLSERNYRKTLSALRKYIDVLEIKVSSNRWDQVEYDHVPAKANLKYEAAFEKHDKERRVNYLFKVATGEAKLNGNGIMPYEIVHRFTANNWFSSTLKEDLLGELMWKHILQEGFDNDWGFEDCIVVADGSGSMYSKASGSTTVSAIEICHSLAIYFAQQLKGVFHNKAISFSMNPQFIDLEQGKTLKDKLEIMNAYNEVANTNIEAVFDMLLDMAVSNEVDPSELPKQVLIISDMEFDMATTGTWHTTTFNKERVAQTLFGVIEEKFEAAGYKLPRLIFWNVCGRTNTIPKLDNDEGICLLSGFSQNAMKIATNRDIKDPYQSLLAVLDGPRYAPVEDAILGLAG